MDLSVQTQNRSYKPRLLKKSLRGQDLFIFRAENSFYKISNLKLADNPLKTLKKKENTDGWSKREVTLEL